MARTGPQTEEAKLTEAPDENGDGDDRRQSKPFGSVNPRCYSLRQSDRNFDSVNNPSVGCGIALSEAHEPFKVLEGLPG